jgi:hypothetical protein
MIVLKLIGWPYCALQIVQHDIAGMRLNYEFPGSTVLALIPTIRGDLARRRRSAWSVGRGAGV